MKNSIKIRFNTFIDKVEYFINYPDVVINNALSKMLGKDVNIKFRLIELIREKRNSEISLDKLKFDVDESIEINGETPRLYSLNSKASDSKDDSNIIMSIFQGLIAAIELDWFNEILEFFGSSLQKLADISFNMMKEISLTFITTLNVIFCYLPDYMRGAAAGTSTTSSLYLFFKDYANSNGFKMDLSVVRAFGFINSLIGFSTDMDSAGDGVFSKKEDTVMNLLGLTIDMVSLFLGPAVGVIVPILSDIAMDVIALRIKGFIFM